MYYCLYLLYCFFNNYGMVVLQMKTPSDILDKDLCIRIHRISRILARRYNAALDGYKITSTQITALLAVSLYPKMGITQLSKLLGMERSSFTRILDGVKAAKFVSLEETGNNRRKVYKLTNEGQQMLDKSFPIMVQLNNNLVKRLDNDFDVDKMFKAFEKLGVEDE